MPPQSPDPAITPTELVGHLKKTAIFSAIADEQLTSLARACQVVRLAPGERLFEQGETGDAAFLILEGAIDIEVPTETGPAIVAKVGVGELVGEIAAFSDRKRNAAVLSAAGARLLRIGREAIFDLMQRDPSCAMNVIAELGGRLDRSNTSVAVMSQAAQALAKGEFEPDMLSALRHGADRFSHFADVFESMAKEITTKHLFQQEMSTAEVIQRSFLPKSINAGARGSQFEVAADMKPAKQVGGDFFDYFMVDDKTLGLAVGDVSGKGIPAAIFMSVTRTVLKTIARRGHPAGEVVAALNDLLAEDNSESMFVTLCYARLDLETGRLDYANAAHEEAYILRADDTPEQIGPEGPAVGLFEGMPYGDGLCQLAPGDTIIFGTDGITEAFGPGGAMYGTERFTALMAGLAGATTKETVAGIMSDVLTFSAGVPQSDDITCLVARYLGP
jgi:sigma-B regulation protein RsbU (phosphoserine phosphatase)